MPISVDHVGREYPATVAYVVSAAKIREFATALGMQTPPGEDLVAPPTFAALVIQPAWDAMFTDPELDLSLSRVVHGEQRFRYDRPVRSGDVLSSTLRIDKVRVRAGSEIVSPVVTVVNDAGEPVLEATATFFHSRESAA